MILTRRLTLLIVLVGAAWYGIAPVSAALLASPSGSLITVKRVEAVFRPAPLDLHGVLVLGNLQQPLPYGDLGNYSFYVAKSLKDFEAKPQRLIPADLTIFPSVIRARHASIRILKGGECVAHPDKRYFTTWTKCDHLRIANVLLIMSSDISTAARKTLVAALRQLGTPTRS